ncbi:MAG TPA: acetate kinase [Firmicutes bacterium]|nr:acetate kinase [Bacillota bacterium]
MLVLVTNVGSTSLKFKLFDMKDETVLASGKIDRIGSPKSAYVYSGRGVDIKEEISAPDYATAIDKMIASLTDPVHGVIGSLDEISAVGFKTVHAKGMTGSLLLDERVIKAMEEYYFIAPAHNPPYVKAIAMFKQAMPGKPMVGVFETSFHQTMPDYAYMYPIPYEWYEKYGIRRFGFHGASHRYVSQRVAQLLGKSQFRLVSCHMGGSSSLCAVKDGKSVDTSLGFSVQAGLPQGTRIGDVDAFVPLYLIKECGLSVDEVATGFAKKSGLAGISGIGSDMRDIQEAASKGNDRARLALDMYCYAVRKYIGAYAAALGGLDAIAFAGGIGENGVEIRAKVLSDMEFMGVKLDPKRNSEGPAERVISAPDSAVTVFVVPTNEELIVARETAKLVAER